MTFNGSILLVDDEVHIRKLVGLIAKQLGDPTILEAGNGAEALDIYESERPDLVLLDISMPVMDGLETLKRLRLLDPDANIIMLTSMANRQSVDEAVTHGALNYLRKDMPREEIREALAETIAELTEPEE